MTMNANANSPYAQGDGPSLLEQVLALPNQSDYWVAPETIVESGGSVTDWTGYQGTTIDLAQASPAARPSFAAAHADFNGHDVVHIDSSAKYMTTPVDAMASLDNSTLFVVAKFNALTAGLFASGFIDSGGTRVQTGVRDPGAGVDYRNTYTTAGATHSDIGPAPIGRAVILCDVFDTAGGVRTSFEDGAAVGSFSLPGAVSLSGVSIYIGQNGGAHSGDGYWLAEIIRIPAVLSDADRAVWHAYLADKYDISLVTLPTVVEELRRAGKLNCCFLGDHGVSIDTGVDVWTGQGPWGREVSNATGSEQPTIVTGQGDRSALRFDGTDDYLEGTWTMTKPALHTYVVAVGSRSEKDSAGIVDGYNPWMLFDTFIGTDGYRIFGGVTNLTGAAATYPRDEAHILEGYFSGAATTFEAWINGTSLGTGDDSGVSDPQGLTVGAFSSVSNFGDCDVSCAVVYESVVGDPRAILEAYYDL